MLKAKPANQSTIPQTQTTWGYMIPPYSICSIQTKNHSKEKDKNYC